MIYFLIILLFIIFNKAEFASKANGGFYRNYLDIDKTNVIKGIFVIMIVFSHASQYINLSGRYDKPYLILKDHLNQMVVAMFLFYSGYGIMYSIMKKGFDYVKGIPRKRLLTVWLNFAIAVCLYWIMDIFLGNEYDIKTVLLSMIGFKSIGNSNWYMFAIFLLYIFVVISFFWIKWLKGNAGYVLGIVLMLALTVGFVYWEKFIIGYPMYCYDTVILFSVGCIYALLKDWIEKIVMHNDFTYAFIFLCVILVYLFTFRHRWDYGIECYSIWAIAFTAIVVLLTMKISFANPFLEYCGKHIFSLYILQRLPMTILTYYGFNSHKYMFIIVSFAVTIVIAMPFDYVTGKISAKISGKSAVKKVND